MMGRLSTLSLATLMGLLSSQTMAKQTFCIFDLAGNSGEIMTAMKEYQVKAASWGADITLKSYTDEKIIAEDFKAGRCDAAGMMGIRAREFVPYAGTVDAIGAIRSNEEMRTLLGVLSRPAAAKFMVKNDYEVAGIISVGQIYLFGKNKAWNKVSDMAGKKLAILPFDKTQRIMAEKVGADPREYEAMKFGVAFNNNAVDIVPMPAVAYKPLELYKGLGDKGGIADYPIMTMTTQMIIRSSKFPKDFAQKSREYVFENFDRFLKIVKQYESAIPATAWVKIPDADKPKHDEMMRLSRIEIAKQGIYDKDMLRTMKRVRCKINPNRSECTEKGTLED